MILRTTNARLCRIIDAMPPGPILFPLVAEVTHLTGGSKPRSRIQVEICYSACIALRKAMYERCYTSKNTMRRGLSSSEHGALQDLVKAANEEARHPALRGVGMVGHETRVFHAWNVGVDLWSPFPIKGERFEILKPYWAVNEEYPSEKFTLWSPEGYAPPSRLDDEALHWRFV